MITKITIFLMFVFALYDSAFAKEVDIFGGIRCVAVNKIAPKDIYEIENERTNRGTIAYLYVTRSAAPKRERISVMHVDMYSPNILYSGSLAANGSVVVYLNDENGFIDVSYKPGGDVTDDIEKWAKPLDTNGPFEVICESTD